MKTAFSIFQDSIKLIMFVYTFSKLLTVYGKWVWFFNSFEGLKNMNQYNVTVFKNSTIL